MTISSSQYSALSVQSSNIVKFKLYVWFDEAFTAQAHLDRFLFGVSQPVRLSLATPQP
jgi:hypothetical protein